MATKNLYSEEGKEKIREMAEDIEFAMLITGLDKKPFHIVPMTTKKVDEDGNIWFLSHRDSKNNQNIAENAEVHLSYSHKNGLQFLTLFGMAEIVHNSEILEELYTSLDDIWFEGKEDPHLTAIKVIPKSAHYWDSKNNKLVTIFVLGMPFSFGDKKDSVDEGDIKL
ncbi:pyridoxamine 5'-phosphate oxidase family protein [Constantimarinum furrinae]|uniref:General stress protein n=1 Tax=Constantimarinum furrinae TaxID=2562285 RepID=A0A7G8PVQ2_9FLAO|nr:pyridoxamine 5'-phosphate oxidase family protein [Constantimarinum furrinae]QNJ98418.1 general stress protein [Constantimarinum furrinae]